MMTGTKRHSALYHLPIIAIGILYFSLITWVLPQESFFTPDSGVKFIQLKEMLKQKTTNPELPYMGGRLDPDLTYQPFSWLVKTEGDKIYSHFSPLYPWLSSFFYQKLGSLGLYVVSALAGFLSLIVMSQIARRFFSDGVALVSSIHLGLATPILFYSLAYWEHALAFFLSIVILLLSLKVIEGSMKLLIALPPLIIICIWARSETVVFIFGLIVAGAILIWNELRQHRQVLVRASAALGILTAGFISFNLVTSRTVWGVHISEHLFTPRAFSSFFDFRLRLKIITTMIGKSGIYMASDFEIFSTLLCMITFVVFLSAVIWARSYKAGVPYTKALQVTLVLSISAMIALSLVNILRPGLSTGLLQVTPFALFSFLHFSQRGCHLRIKFIQATALFYLLGTLFMPTPGGMQWGPRYILYSYPLLIILFWDARSVIEDHFSKSLRPLLKGAFFFLLLCSFPIQFTGIRESYAIKTERLEMRNVIEKEPTGVIVSNFEHFLATYSPDLYDKKVFFNATRENIRALLQRLLANGIREFSFANGQSMFPWKRVSVLDLTNMTLYGAQGDPGTVRIVEKKYRYPLENKGLVLTVFEIK
jgi:hypothetical protein